MTLATLPDPKFIGWFRWTALQNNSLDPETAQALQEVGTYLIAQFRDGVPASVDRTEPRIFYVGETHGPTRSLRARLTDFGRSAGFFGKQRSGHYAAWEFPDYAEKNGIDVSHVHVAVCPYIVGSNSAHDARGIFPTLIEAMILWSYTSRHGCMPALNNSGRQGEPTPPPAWDAEAVRSLFSTPEPFDAVERLLTTLAESHRYAPRAFKRWNLDGWSGSERPFGGGYWASIGWRHDNREIGLWLTNGKDHRFDTDGRSATDEAQVRALLNELWSSI
ncbi:MAG: hypothetical protein KIT31_38845 [Deltaproteobacteria bacterium]|nr:hypothetical protein [Deltaproteobacteria bacterium]